MHQQVETRQDTWQVVTKADQPDMADQSEVLDLLPQRRIQGPLAENQHLRSGAGGQHGGQGLKQKAVPLAGNQLRDHADDRIGRLEAEGGCQPALVGAMRERRKIEGIANDAQLSGRQSLAQQHPTDTVGNRHDPVMQPVFERHGQAAFGVVLTPGMHRGHAGQPRGDAAHDIGADAAVQVNDIGARGANQPMEADDEAEIQITAHVDFSHLGASDSGLGQRDGPSADEMVFMTQRLQSFHQQH